MLSISAGIGIFYAIKDYFTKKHGDASEFLMGGRKLGIVPVAVSILVSFMSAILILGFPAEMYTAGTQFSLGVLALVIAIILSTILFVPLFYPLKLTSCFEYLELRFQSKLPRLLGTFLMVLNGVMYTGIASYAPSTALEAVTGFPTWATIVTVGCVSTFYTFLGGMKAVVWTDVFQATIMISGLVAILVKGAVEAGGLSEVWKTNEEWNRIEFWEGDPDPTLRHSFWSIVVGQALGWLGTYGVSQTSVQRYCAVSTLREARSAVMLNVIGIVSLVGVASLTGVVMFAYYAKLGCDPLTDGQVDNPNQLVPLFVMDVLNIPGLPGLFLSCLFSAALSSVSSSLNALSAVTWEDMLKPVLGDRIKEHNKTWVMRFLVILYGIAGVGFAFIVQSIGGGTVLQVSITFSGATGGPLTGLFLLAALFPWANWIGCVVGGVVSLAFSLWLSVGAFDSPSGGGRRPTLEFPTNNCTLTESNVTMTTMSMLSTSTLATEELSGLQQFYTISYLWYPAIGMITLIVVGLIVSFITGPMRIGDTDPKYLIPFFDRLFCCLPNKLLVWLRCGQEFQRPEDISKVEKDIEVQFDDIADTKDDIIPVISHNGESPSACQKNGQTTQF